MTNIIFFHCFVTHICYLNYYFNFINKIKSIYYFNLK